MNDLDKLKFYLCSKVDKYRIIFSNKKEIRYVKLFDGNEFCNIICKNYKVYVELMGAKFHVESTDIDFIINTIDDWCIDHISLDDFQFFEIKDYSEKIMIRDKSIYDSFDFKLYRQWLDEISKDVFENGTQTFQYYANVELVQLVIDNKVFNQYLTQSQMLHYDILNSCFLIRDSDIFVGDKMDNTKYQVFDIEKNRSLYKDLSIVKVNLVNLNKIILPALSNLKGENILYANSPFSINYLNKLWIDEAFNIDIEPMLIFDSSGYPCKRISLIKNGVIVSFINTALSSKIFETNETGFNPFEEGQYGNYNSIRYYINTNIMHNDTSTVIDKVIDSQAINEKGKIKIKAIVVISHNSTKNIMSISFYLEDLFKVLKKKNDDYYYFENSICLETV